MRWNPVLFSITAAFAVGMADDLAKLPVQATEVMVAGSSDDRKLAEARDNFDRAVATACRELDERDAPALLTTAGAWGDWIVSVLQVAAARTERDDFERTGYETQRGNLQEELVKEQRTFAHHTDEAQRLIALIESGKPVPDDQRAIVIIQLQRSSLHVEQAQTALSVYEKYYGPRQRRQLTNEVNRAEKEAIEAWARYQAQITRLRHKLEALVRLQKSEWTLADHLVRELKAHTMKLATSNGSVVVPLGNASRRNTQPLDFKQNREAVFADLTQFSRNLSRWYVVSSALKASLLTTP